MTEEREGERGEGERERDGEGEREREVAAAAAACQSFKDPGWVRAINLFPLHPARSPRVPVGIQECDG